MKDETWDEVLIGTMSVFHGDPANWRVGDSNLLPDRERFICPMCRDVHTIAVGLGYLIRAGKSHLPGPEVVCNECWIEHGESLEAERARKKLARKE